MKLLRIEDYQIKIEPQLLAIECFRKIWTRDKSKDKARAVQEISYVYFMADPRSDYQYLIDQELRSQTIKENEGLPEKWQPDEQVRAAMEFYNGFRSVTALLLEDTRIAVDKVRQMLREFDPNATDKNGKPLYPLNMITSTIKQIPDLIKGLDEAEKAINREMVQSENVRGSQEKAIFEDL